MIVPGIRIVPGDADVPFAAFLRPPPPRSSDHLSDEAAFFALAARLLHLSPPRGGLIERDVPQR